jgi:D-alanine-D-alanine ligase-like ATP-grasp enzyme
MQVKAADTEKVVAVEDGPVRDSLIALAKAVFRELGGRDYGRIDIRMDDHGSAHFLEANLIPGVAHNDFISYFTHACMLNNGMDYEEMILKIVDVSIKRRGLSSKENKRVDSPSQRAYAKS